MARLLSRAAAAALALLAALPAAALERPDVQLLVDVRAVLADGQTSFLDGGLGKLRFDEDHDGLALGELGLAYRQDLAQTLKLSIDVVAYGDGDKNPVDLNEAFVEWRPWPSSAWRSRLKVGAFYPPVSTENVLAGWRSPYSISWSAVNTWIGEELRTLGAEYTLDWLGTKTGSAFDVGVVVAAFAWNDPAGIVIANRGWAMHDRQTSIFGRFGKPGPYPLPSGHTLFAEIDHRPGWYAGLEARFADRLEARVLHYDNRGDRVSYDAGVDDFAWDTPFDAVALSWTPTDRLTLLAQWLKGETYIDPFMVLEWEYESAFVLASYGVGDHRFTLRRDWFDMQQNTGSPAGRNADDGTGWTLAWMYEIDSHWTLALEGMEIDSTLAARADIGDTLHAVERTLQLALRARF